MNEVGIYPFLNYMEVAGDDLIIFLQSYIYSNQLGKVIFLLCALMGLSSIAWNLSKRKLSPYGIIFFTAWVLILPYEHRPVGYILINSFFSRIQIEFNLGMLKFANNENSPPDIIPLLFNRSIHSGYDESIQKKLGSYLNPLFDICLADDDFPFEEYLIQSQSFLQRQAGRSFPTPIDSYGDCNKLMTKIKSDYDSIRLDTTDFNYLVSPLNGHYSKLSSITVIHKSKSIERTIDFLRNITPMFAWANFIKDKNYEDTWKSHLDRDAYKVAMEKFQQTMNNYLDFPKYVIFLFLILKFLFPVALMAMFLGYVNFMVIWIILFCAGLIENGIIYTVKIFSNSFMMDSLIHSHLMNADMGVQPYPAISFSSLNDILSISEKTLNELYYIQLISFFLLLSFCIYFGSRFKCYFKQEDITHKFQFMINKLHDRLNLNVHHHYDIQNHKHIAENDFFETRKK
jgi:hypothetical protein